jgi:hypothetical protein
MAIPSTRATIRDSVMVKAKLDATNDIAKVNDWIDLSYMQVASETRCFQTNANVDLTAGAESYIPDALILHIELLTVTPVNGNAYYPLKECSLDEILNLRAGNVATGPPRRYALVGLNQVEFWPAASAGDVLGVWYSYLPDALSEDDVPLIPEPFGTSLLEYGALIHAVEFKKDILMLGDYQQQYASWLAAFQRYVNRKGGAFPQAFTTWTGTGGWIPYDRSTDIPRVG